LRQERSLLDDLRVQLARLDASDEDQERLKQSLRQLDELFLLVIVGEFNAGKTAFLNALLGSRLLPEGVTPTTAHIHVLRYGEVYRHEHGPDDLVVVYLPVKWLQELNLVDTPGVNAVIQRHQEITEDFVPRSDLVLFVTSADRPFSESERAFLERVRQWGKKIVVVVNKIDLIESAQDRQQILDFVSDNARTLLGIDPVIFPVSARLALQAKQAAKEQNQPAPSGPLWQASHFAALEAYLLNTLDTGERLRLKLANPLGVATNLLEKYSAVMADRLSLLSGDFETLDTIDAQLAAYEADMRHDFQFQRSRVDNVLYEMIERGDRFFDETMRLGRIFDLVNSQKISLEFERQVMADTSRQIEHHVNELIDWMVDKDFRQWRAMTEYLNRRWAQHADRIMGQLGSTFELTRQGLLASVGREAQRVVDGYDPVEEANKLAQEVQASIMQTAAIEVGALGLGAILVAILHTTLLDFTGILSASALAALGFYLLPYKRSQLKTELRRRINALREGLDDVLTRQFESELSAGVQRMREAIGPYTRFVRVEREKLERLQSDMTNMKTANELLHKQVRMLK
jgi:small GTP-binding protein